MNNYIAYDCIVIGGGITGSALAYELVKHKLRVLLLEKDRFSNNATTYSYGGLAYWSGTNEIISTLFQEGIELYRQLGNELEQNIEFREIDLLLTIDAQDDPAEVLYDHQHFAIKPELLDIKSACQLEPLLHPKNISGALKLPHGHVHPTKINAGYQEAFKRLGGEIIYEPVTQLLQEQPHHIQGVITPSGRYQGAQTIICAGGLSRSLLQDIGISLQVYFTSSHVLKVAQQKELKLSTLVMPAKLKRFSLESRVTQPESDFLWDKPSTESVADVLDVGAVQFLDGSLYLGQFSQIITDPYSPGDTKGSKEKIKQGISKILPRLGELPVSHHQCLVAFTGEPNHPRVGKIAQWEGLSVFCGFTSTMLVAPPLARRFATSLAQGESEMKDIGLPI